MHVSDTVSVPSQSCHIEEMRSQHFARSCMPESSTAAFGVFQAGCSGKEAPGLPWCLAGNSNTQTALPSIVQSLPSGLRHRHGHAGQPLHCRLCSLTCDSIGWEAAVFGSFAEINACPQKRHCAWFATCWHCATDALC